MVSPACPKTHMFHKKTCSCKKIAAPKKFPKSRRSPKRCPKGTRRNKKTGLCESNEKTLKRRALDMSRALASPKKQPRKRCPKGTRKNKKTGLCERAGALITIDNKDHPLKKLVSGAIHSLAKSPRGMPDAHQLVPAIRTELIRTKSFSPEINKILMSMRPGSHSDIFGCGLSLKNIGESNFKISVGTKKVKGITKHICANSNSIVARKTLLNNLKRANMIDCNNIIAPVQKLSNCWFNTMFMSLFISDKGRKFFKYFRQLMIEGKQSNGVVISPPRLRKAFFLLNACIEASQNISSVPHTKDIALAMDTNNVIEYIYKSIPADRRNILHGLKKVDEPGNPIYYYKSLVNYLGNHSIHMLKIESPDIIKNVIFGNPDNVRAEHFLNFGRADKKLPGNNTTFPDIIAITLQDASGEGPHTANSNITNKPEKFTMKSNNGETITYALDSIIIRNTEQEHFVSVLMCNKKEKTFDGASIGRLHDFNWKSLLNRNSEWTYKYKTAGFENMKWNFCNGYMVMFYYRIN